MQENDSDAPSHPTLERGRPGSQTDATLAARGLPFTAPKTLRGGGIKTSLVQLVYEAILAELDDGKLRPGQRIVASAVASRLKLSRAPVREALHVLAGRGLVELQPDRGALLRKLYREDLAELYELAGPGPPRRPHRPRLPPSWPGPARQSARSESLESWRTSLID